jgi:hypothetical protein
LATDASAQYNGTFSGEYYGLSNELVDPYISGTFQHPEDAPISSDYMYDAQFVLESNFNVEPDSQYYWNHASGLVDSHDSLAATPQAPSAVTSSDIVLPAPALPQFQFQPSGFISPATGGPTQPLNAIPLTCPYGCRGTFGRSNEYRRHMKKHQGRNFLCTQPSCGKSFYRNDKLCDHLGQAHKIAPPGRAHATGLQNFAARGSGQIL